jgi:hypothetical protein
VDVLHKKTAHSRQTLSHSSLAAGAPDDRPRSTGDTFLRNISL